MTVIKQKQGVRSKRKIPEYYTKSLLELKNVENPFTSDNWIKEYTRARYGLHVDKRRKTNGRKK